MGFLFFQSVQATSLSYLSPQLFRNSFFNNASKFYARCVQVGAANAGAVFSFLFEHILLLCSSVVCWNFFPPRENNNNSGSNEGALIIYAAVILISIVLCHVYKPCCEFHAELTRRERLCVFVGEDERWFA